MRKFAGKKVAILGVSVEGLDAVKFFSQEGAEITACDRRTKEELGETYRQLHQMGVQFQLGPTYLKNLVSFDEIVRTPGMTLRTPEFEAVRKAGLVVTSVTKLFFALCKAPIIGVTGTKGKGTTSTLIAEYLKTTGKKVYLGGNVGVPLLSLVRHMTPQDLVVLELSSFQLEDLTQSPTVAVVLMITVEHLANYDALATNFHLDRDAYVDAKKSIVKFQRATDLVICNADDPTSLSFADLSAGRKQYFSRNRHDVEAFTSNDRVYLVTSGKPVEICELSHVQLRGRHNLDNIAAAALAATHFGVGVSELRKVTKQFKPLPHRLEFVKTVDEVHYYDDSFSTTPETTIAAIVSFDEPIILIAGGSEKGSEYGEMGEAITRSRVKAVIAIGEMTERIVAALKAARFTGEIITGCRSMPEIVTIARRTALRGDVVLLSPACASFGMFKNYKDRGDQFKHDVGLL